jgi:phage-related tail fiber protein
MPLPLVGAILEAYNNLPAIPPGEPLGDLLNSILTSSEEQSFKTAARAATVVGQNLALSGLVGVDGVTPIEGDRILVKNQTDATENGIYVASADAWTRSTDADDGDKLADASVVYAKEGTQNANTAWQVVTDDPITLGTTDIEWEEFTPPTTFIDSVRLASTGNLSLSGFGNIDGTGVNDGDRVLAKNQTDPTENGIYIASMGMWDRAPDASDGDRLSASAIVFVQEGVSQADTAWQLTTNNPIVVGTTALAFAEFGAGGSLTVFEANAAGDITTTASNFTTVTSMEIPNIGIGSYFVWFTTDVEADSSGVSVEVNISVDNTEVTNSRRIFTRQTDNIRVPLSCAALVTTTTVNEDIRIRWRRQPGGGPPPTITMGNRAMLVIKVS